MTKPIVKWIGASLLAITMSQSAFGQTVYSQPTVASYATGANAVEKSATAAPDDLNSFTNAVAAAFQNDMGGVFNFPTTPLVTGTTIFRGTFGTGVSKRIDLTTSQAMQSVNNSGSFTQISDPIAAAQSADSSGYTITIGPVLDATTAAAIPGQGVTRIGFTILARTHATYPCDVRATATFNDNSTSTLTATVGNPKGADDTFYAFSAPAGKVIQSVDLRSFAVGTQDPVNTRIAFDDFGFIVATSATPPVIENLSPRNFAIHKAADGIHFNAVAAESAPIQTIQLVLNGQDVSSQLQISGETTNRTVTFNGLTPDTDYSYELTVGNAAGTISITNQFYTATQPFTLYNSEGFTNDTLYPPGPLTAVTHGRATWEPHPSEPASIIQAEEPQGKVLEKINSGASRADWLHFPPVSSGTLIIELDAFVSATTGRTIDITLSPQTSADMASFVAWGGVPDKLAWFDNTNWLPISDLQAGWHHYKIVNYLSGPAAGFFDVFVNEVKVGDKLKWRNAIPGTPLGRLRFHSQDINPILEYGWIDNLTLTAAPEDPNAFPPPAIVNLLPGNNAVIAPSEGFSFQANSGLPIATGDIHAILNGTDISSGLVIGGTANARTVSYAQLTEGIHNLEISVMNAGGTTTLTQRFVATSAPLALFDSGGFEDDLLYPLGPLTAVEDDGAIWAPAANAPGELVRITRVEEEVTKVLRRVQVGADAIDLLRFPPVSSGVLTIDFDARVSVDTARTLDFCLNHAASGSMASFLGWGTVAAQPEKFAYYNGSAWIPVSDHGTTWHRYTTVNYLSGPNIGKYDLKVDGVTVGEKLPFRHAFPAGTAVGVLRIGAIRGTVPGEFGDVDNLKITVEPLVAPTPGLKLENVGRAGNNFTFTFVSQVGLSHIVEYKTALSDPTWTTLETIPGDGSPKTVVDPSPISGTRFFRVRTP